MGLFVLILLAVVSGVLWHYLVPNYALAVVGATVSTIVVFQVIAFLQLGQLDPFLLIAAVTSGGLALVVACLVGLPVYARRSAARDAATRSRSSEA